MNVETVSAGLAMRVVVDCDIYPKLPSTLFFTGEGTEHRRMGLVTLEKRADGKLYVNDREVVRCKPRKQLRGNWFLGRRLRKDVQALNACIMDALLANPQLIPDAWVGCTYFLGTIFCDDIGRQYAGYLWGHGGNWNGSYYWLPNLERNSLATSLAN